MKTSEEFINKYCTQYKWGTVKVTLVKQEAIWDNVPSQEFLDWLDTKVSRVELPVIKKNAGIEFRPDMDEIDEICADNCSIHLEYMDDTDIWMAIEKGEETFHVHIQTKKAHIKTWAEKC